MCCILDQTCCHDYHLVKHNYFRSNLLYFGSKVLTWLPSSKTDNYLRSNLQYFGSKVLTWIPSSETIILDHIQKCRHDYHLVKQIIILDQKCCHDYHLVKHNYLRSNLQYFGSKVLTWLPSSETIILDQIQKWCHDYHLVKQIIILDQKWSWLSSLHTNWMSQSEVTYSENGMLWRNKNTMDYVEALIFRDHGIAEKPIWNGIPDFLPNHY